MKARTEVIYSIRGRLAKPEGLTAKLGQLAAVHPESDERLQNQRIDLLRAAARLRRVERSRGPRPVRRGPRAGTDIALAVLPTGEVVVQCQQCLAYESIHRLREWEDRQRVVDEWTTGHVCGCMQSTPIEVHR